MTTWTATLPLRVISRKNSSRVIKMGSRYSVRSSLRYESFRDEAVLMLKGQRPTEPIRGPLSLQVAVFIKGRNRIDLDNAVAAVCDVLQSAEVIENDDDIDILIARKERGHKDWSVEMTVRSTD